MCALSVHLSHVFVKHPACSFVSAGSLFEKKMKLGVSMYQMISGNYILDGRSYTSYGIRWENDKIEDLSIDRTAVETLVSLCNMYALSPVHLQDIIMDFLAAPDDPQWRTPIVSTVPAFAMQI